MTVRFTSAAAYADAISKGLIGRAQRKVLDTLIRENRDMSLKEISQMIDMPMSSVSGRVHELKQVGAVIEKPNRKCNVSHRLIKPVAVSAHFVGALS